MQEEVCEGLAKQPAVFEAVQANVQKQQDRVRKRKLEQGWDDDFQVGGPSSQKEHQGGAEEGW